MKQEKEVWITEVESTLGEIHRLSADVTLLEKIRNRASKRIPSIEHVSAQTVWLAAAGIILLVALNLTILSRVSGGSQAAVNTSSLTENDFDIYSNS